MKTLIKAIGREFKKVFEGNRCRFADGCKLYQSQGIVCNNLFERFPNDEKAYCGRYRSMEEDEEKGEVK